MAKANVGYVDGFVFTVAKKNLAAYRAMARLGAKMWMKNGAIDYVECVGDDLVPKKGMSVPGGTSFIKMNKPKANEIVCFSYITFKSKAHRDAVNAKVMKDPLMNDPKFTKMPMPFDMKRMAYGGFKVVVKG